MWNTSDIGGRICHYIYIGDLKTLLSLFNCGFLKGDDTLHFTESEIIYDSIPLIHCVARYNCLNNYKEILDLLIEKGADINSNYTWCLPMTEALVNHNYNIAAYLESKGAKYEIDDIDDDTMQKYIDYKSKFLKKNIEIQIE
jgi:hypothetical protein